ncbi:MAG TPA: SIMPL domain-containing protein [Steroidobacteraceae bacterium]|jgi:hypothetical protein
MKTLVTLSLAALFSMGIVSHTRAQTAAPSMSSIRVTGSAVVSVSPDRAYVDVGVTTQSPQSEVAVSQNAAKIDTVLKALRKSLGQSADIKTLSYTLNPEYQSRGVSSGGQQTVSGYIATNVVRVTVDDIGKIGNVIDTATQAGANRIPSIQFALRDEQTVRRQALRDAAIKARADAEALAATLGLKVNRILTVEESGPAAVPVRQVMFAARAESSPGTAIQTGSLDVNATVVLTVEVGSGR